MSLVSECALVTLPPFMEDVFRVVLTDVRHREDNLEVKKEVNLEVKGMVSLEDKEEVNLEVNPVIKVNKGEAPLILIKIRIRMETNKVSMDRLCNIFPHVYFNI